MSESIYDFIVALCGYLLFFGISIAIFAVVFHNCSGLKKTDVSEK